jgi:inorganic pyrophosphatase
VSNLAAIANKWDAKKSECKVIIETPKGGRNKFNYDPEFELFTLGALLPEGLVFPYDFGFVPSTLGGDGDPLDVLVLMDEPAHVGCLLDVRLIGIMEARQLEDGTSNRNDRLIAVALHSYSHQEVTSVQQLPGRLLDQVTEFFISYNKSAGKKFTVKGCHGPKHAAAAVEAGMTAFQNKLPGKKM